MSNVQVCVMESATDVAPACECVWSCARGRTRLSCQMRSDGDESVQLEVLRNSRVYGSYRFDGRTAALTFAHRLCESFQGNGWVPA